MSDKVLYVTRCLECRAEIETPDSGGVITIAPYRCVKCETRREAHAKEFALRPTSGVPLNTSAVASGGVAPATGEEF